MMTTTTPSTRTHAPSAPPNMKAFVTKVLLLLFLTGGLSDAARAQAAKLPSPDKIVGEYLKAVGGKRSVAALRDVTYEWDVTREGREAGTARTHLKAPGALRTDFLLADGEWDAAANPRTAWLRARDGRLSTLTDREAFAARLQALLESAYFADYKKQKVLARTVAREEVGGAAAYKVEFATRAGARLRYWFDAGSKLLLQSEDEARRLRVRFADWRARAASPLKAEPHRVEIEREGEPALTLTLKGASYNTGLAESFFEPPADATLDIPALLRDLSKNQEETDKRINDYTFTRKVTEREMDDKGVLKKEKVTVYEVYPFAGYGWVQKLVSENGVPLAPEREARELKRVAEELEKAEREAPRRTEKRERERAERRAKQRAKAAKSGAKGEGEEDEDDVEISTFLRACEFFSPRRERFRDRDVIVFDFRPRAGFKPSNRGESLVSKLSGVIWIDPAERQVMRLEARLVESFKMGGGLLAAVKPGSAFLFEQTRLEDGIWLPRYSQVNASARVMLFAGMSINATNEFSDFKRFSTKTGEDKLDRPKEANPPQP
jgi:predicted nuclease with RNAse H fold